MTQADAQVVYAAATRSDLLDDHTAVSQTGVATVAQAFQVGWPTQARV